MLSYLKEAIHTGACTHKSSHTYRYTYAHKCTYTSVHTHAISLKGQMKPFTAQVYPKPTKAKAPLKLQPKLVPKDIGS